MTIFCLCSAHSAGPARISSMTRWANTLSAEQVPDAEILQVLVELLVVELER